MRTDFLLQNGKVITTNIFHLGQMNGSDVIIAAHITRSIHMAKESALHQQPIRLRLEYSKPNH